MAAGWPTSLGRVSIEHRLRRFDGTEAEEDAWLEELVCDGT